MAKSILRTTFALALALVLCAAMLTVPQRAANAAVMSVSDMSAVTLTDASAADKTKSFTISVNVTTGDAAPTLSFTGGTDVVTMAVGAGVKRATSTVVGEDTYDFTATATFVKAGAAAPALYVNGADSTKTVAVTCKAAGSVLVNSSSSPSFNLTLVSSPTTTFSVGYSGSPIAGLEYEIGTVTGTNFTVSLNGTSGSITGTAAGSGSFVVQPKASTVPTGSTVSPVTVNVVVNAAPAAAPTLSVTRDKSELWPSAPNGTLSIVLSNANTTYPANAYYYVYCNDTGKANFVNNSNPLYGNLTSNGSGSGTATLTYTRGNTVGTATVTVRVYESSTGVTATYKEASVTIVNNATTAYLYLDLDDNTLTNSTLTTTARAKLWPVINNGVYYPSVTDRVYWRSSNSKIVSIESYDGNFDSNLNATAKLKARRNGTVTIYAYMGDWSNPTVIGSHTITVNASYLPQTGQDMTLVYVGCGLSLFLLMMGAWVYYAQRKELKNKA